MKTSILNVNVAIEDNYEINAIKDVCLENNILTFSTVHGTYKVGTLINIEL